MYESAEILLPLAMRLPPGEETYYFREPSGRGITTQKEEDRRREKRQRGTTDCGQHWTCALHWSLFPPRVTFLAGCNFYAPPLGVVSCFPPSFNETFFRCLSWWTHSALHAILPLGEQFIIFHPFIIISNFCSPQLICCYRSSHIYVCTSQTRNLKIMNS